MSAQRALIAHQRIRFSLIAMPPIYIAATAVTLRLTRPTVPSTVHGLLLSSKLSFLHLSDLLKSAMWI